ncbi:hypothetical protein [Acidianus sp. HS-5]|uniref:hypothetical protein n=1 Tax=Acidianus sp. HS-5 TaxID=2886040 RepID=UPI001F3B8526|nr:hypothetical protein [Acidianus sp. HS-5]BDC18201.1 hypothetical protein HS5_10910 [Acidianus sp. HS-5]
MQRLNLTLFDAIERVRKLKENHEVFPLIAGKVVSFTIKTLYGLDEITFVERDGGVDVFFTSEKVFKEVMGESNQ